MGECTMAKNILLETVTENAGQKERAKQHSMRMQSVKS